MNRIDRLFGILTLLQSKKYVAAEKIAERFEISVRTVYRDVKALCESGIPVSFEPSKGYFIVQGYFLSPVAFTTEEANALLLMESLALGFADRSIKTHYSTALNKVKSVLRSGQKEQLEQLHENTHMQLPARFSSDTDYLSHLQEAVSTKKIIEINYANKSGETSTREIESIGLIFYAFSWHLFAWCHLRQEYRDFRVSRITGLRKLQLEFRIPKHRSLKEFMQELPVDF